MPIRDLLVEDHGQTAVDLLFLGLDGSLSGHGTYVHEEIPAAVVCYGLVDACGCGVPGRAGGNLFAAGEVYGVVLAHLESVHACDAARVVDRMVFVVDARGLAGSRAERAILAFVRVDGRMPD